MKLAPIALFVYNRLDHTRQTVASLQKNTLATESDLFVFSDAAKSPEVEEKVKAVREFIKGISGFRSITIIERELNLGLAKSIIDGVTRLCNEYGQVIVLEDDLVTSPYFLKFMNDGLEFYENEEEVISIHGYIYPVKAELPETFFLRGADCWGWATWKRGWDIFEPDGKKLLTEIKGQNVDREFNYDGTFNLTDMLRSQVQGKIDSWAIRWYASAFLKNKLTLYPGKSLVFNIGNDSSGTHCGTTEMFSGKLFDQPLTIGRLAIEESLEGRTAVVNYFYANRNSLVRRVINIIERFWKKCMK
jgi:hypothetical protein